MAGPPTGTLTFLFTDIEGSTRLWERHPQAMRRALSRHDEILRRVTEEQHGYVFKTVGDAFCCAFPTATDALEAALEAQRGLLSSEWEETGPLKVRMALHIGVAEERAGDYFGPPLNRVARLLSAAHGGQVLLSLPAQELVRDQLPSGAALMDLGEKRLKDLFRPPGDPSLYAALAKKLSSARVVVACVGVELARPLARSAPRTFDGRERVEELLGCRLCSPPNRLVQMSRLTRRVTTECLPPEEPNGSSDSVGNDPHPQYAIAHSLR